MKTCKFLIYYSIIVLVLTAHISRASQAIFEPGEGSPVVLDQEPQFGEEFQSTQILKDVSVTAREHILLYQSRSPFTNSNLASRLGLSLDQYEWLLFSTANGEFSPANLSRVNHTLTTPWERFLLCQIRSGKTASDLKSELGLKSGKLERLSKNYQMDLVTARLFATPMKCDPRDLVFDPIQRSKILRRRLLRSPLDKAVAQNVIGERLRAFRERLHLSRADVAQAMGVSHAIVKHWESPKGDIYLAYLNKLRFVLALSKEEVLGLIHTVFALDDPPVELSPLQNKIENRREILLTPQEQRCLEDRRQSIEQGESRRLDKYRLEDSKTGDPTLQWTSANDRFFIYCLRKKMRIVQLEASGVDQAVISKILTRKGNLNISLGIAHSLADSLDTDPEDLWDDPNAISLELLQERMSQYQRDFKPAPYQAAELFRRFRERLHLTAEAMEAAVGGSSDYVRKMEANDNLLTVVHLAQAREVYELSDDEVLEVLSAAQARELPSKGRCTIIAPAPPANH